MANSLLRGTYFKCPDRILQKMEGEINNFEGDGNKSDGYNRAKKLIKNNGKMKYEQLKRIKNYLDNAEDPNDVEYRLNGGDDMKKWVESALRTARNLIYNMKKTRSDAGEENVFKKPHTKDKSKNPTDVNVPKVHKGSQNRNVTTDKVTYESTLNEEINGIKYLIEYLNNENNNKQQIN